MAEPTNTPVPASTPRSASPTHPHPHHLPHGANAPIIPVSIPPLSPSKFASTQTPTGPKPRVLHIGDPVRYNPETFIALNTQCEVIRPPAEDRQRDAFIQALKERRWGDFHAIFRPFWGSGGEMGHWDAELVDLLPTTMKVFASAGAGFDWADTQLLGDRGIVYCNAGLAAAEAVADFALAMIISTFRVLPWCINSALSDDPSAFTTCHKEVTAQSHNLRGHIVGLVGLGNIGQQIATRCRHGFGMDVHYYDVAPISESVEATIGGAMAHKSLESLIRTADCVVLCAPAVPSGEGDAGKKPLIGAQELSWFREGGRFINVARGSLVDDNAVADALDTGRLASVALDVHPDEPQISPRLKAHAKAGRAMLTCHNAGGTVETHKGFEELSMRNVMAVLGGGKPITPVNLQYLK